ncbi:glutamine synthetase, type I [Methanocella conradii HZ254]|uniref:Glutamine synthetase n=1 Tax=Methanocella conradii (strain DSM 24694 / JCM 17849 / CGMCC 1.5162 / HZ254) TaxID=1041930 RepID=H8I4H8_METCZ|nr:type I glutamate--ammonia ligase [Methanocella conradii]AFD00157.1 glutamine synthetase, type I [Methanocella conradii HZ254]MDI6896021.1 type I glutamate--ammonia ligase [Methanocella conradii]
MASDNMKKIEDIISKNRIKYVDYKFIDVPGTWQHKTHPIAELTEDVFKYGTGFDGSSIRGFQGIEESDMLLIPDAESAFVDPFIREPTLSLICDVYDPDGLKPYSRDPRYIARKAEKYMASTGIADAAYFGPELEFFIFDDVQFDVLTPYKGMGYSINSNEAIWNSNHNSTPNLGHRPRFKEGYFPVPPTDTQTDIRNEMAETMMRMGMKIELHHHEVATAGQAEIGIRFNTLTRMADQTMMYKYAVKNVALRNGKTATFMPKPLFGDNGSGMHTHQSLWKGGEPLFFDRDGYAMLSRTALYYIGGLLTHAHSLLAFCSPSTNSYKRLVPGYEAPVNLVFSSRNRSAAVRIPMYSDNPKSKRIEFRPPDGTCNPYLAFAAMLMAGLDGIQNKIDPTEAGFGPINKNIYHLPEEEKKKIKSVPGSLDEALAALEKDHDYLTKGGVFSEEFINAWIEYKRTTEIDPVRIRTHPYELYLYYDA